MPIDSSLGSALVNLFELKTVFYRQYVDDNFVLFKKEDTAEIETINKLYFLNIEISRGKPTFSSIISFPDTTLGLVSTLFFCCYSVSYSTELIIVNFQLDSGFELASTTSLVSQANRLTKRLIDLMRTVIYPYFIKAFFIFIHCLKYRNFI